MQEWAVYGVVVVIVVRVVARPLGPERMGVWSQLSLGLERDKS